VTPTAQRGLAAGALGLAIVVGLALSARLAPDSDARVAESRDVPGAIPERDDAGSREVVLDDGSFVHALGEDAARFGVPPVGVGELKAVHPYADEVDRTVVLARGKTWRSEHLEITAAIDDVTYHQRGAKVTAAHSLAIVKNIGARPIGYFLRLASTERGHCEVRGARPHNAMALEPGEVAEIVVCAGEGGIRIEDVQVLEVTALGHRYLSQVPPRAVGGDAITDGAHRTDDAVRRCRLDASDMTDALSRGSVVWADVADFYARHDCHRFSFPAGYRRAVEPLRRLPVEPVGP